MAYSLSKNIQIFPVTQRNIWDPLGRLTTEYNLTSILNRLLDVNGFVFTENNTSGDKKSPRVTSATGGDSTLDFNLNGYVIHIESLQSILESLGYENDIYANIITTHYNSNSTYEKEHFRHLVGVDTTDSGGEIGSPSDSTDIYEGVIFTSGAKHQLSEAEIATLISPEVHSLKILEYKQVSHIINPEDESYNSEQLKNSNEYSSSGLYIPKESQIKFQSNLKRTSISIDDGVI